MKIHFVVVVASVLTSSLLVGGQVGPESRRSGEPREFDFAAGKIVTDAPYMADVNNSSVRILPDGNRIERTMTGKVARDSRGRTYSTETMSGFFGQTGVKIVTFISDPVAGYTYALNAEAKTATRRPLHVRDSGLGEGRRRDASRLGLETVDLGTQLVNGLNAQGKKKTHTIPAGEMGNAQPIISTNETWFSADLQVIVSAKRSDPREGTSTYALNNIEKIEPPAALFQVPAEYTIKDAPAFGQAGLGARL